MSGGNGSDFFYRGRGFDDSEVLDFQGGIDHFLPGSIKINRGKF